MSDFEKAKQWRKDRGLSVAQLAELSGYCIENIYNFEKGGRADRGGIDPFAWQRYRNVCAGIDAQIRSGIVFNWGK